MFHVSYQSHQSLKTLKTIIKHSCSLVLLLIFAVIPSQAIADVAGKTILAKGEVKATNSDTAEIRKLRRRAKIFSVDSIITGKGSKAQFSMSDGGLITLKENTEIKISEYSFDKESKQGSATLEVVSGGLRSISGLIKKSGGDYQVKTPVGSIGIRGTHFAVEVVNNNVVFGVFSGNIDVKLNNQQTLSLGASEDFAFASVNPAGQVTLLTQAPPSIAAGLSAVESSEQPSDDGDSNESTANDNESTSSDTVAAVNESDSSDNVSSIETDSESSNSEINIDTDSEVALDASLYNESEWQGIEGSPIAELIAERSGTLIYDNIFDSDISSTEGGVQDFSMTMTIDFDNGSVPDGSISFTDQQGEWFAAYSGLINIDQLDLGINFASHGDNRAGGSISAAFSNGLDEITGTFNLFELDDQLINAGGSFKIKP